MADGELRVSLDVSAVPAQPVGAGQYTLELARALSARDDVELVLVARRSDRERWRSIAPRGQLLLSVPAPRPLRLGWEQVRMPALLAREQVAVHHGPHYTMPRRAKLPVVVTVHDLSYFEAPRWHERAKVPVFRRAITVAARRAAVVVCPSRVTADELRRWCRVDAEVVVAPHGVDAVRFSPVEPAPGADAVRLAGLDRRLGGGAPFVLFVGTLEPRKDVPSLVAAFARVVPRHPDSLLVLAGGRGWGADAVDRAVAEAGLDDRVIRTGYVEDAAVPVLLRAATVVAYPALYEGFGLPALEALACGAPLVTTEGTAMAEVAGDAAVLVPPGDPVALADALDAELEAGGSTGPDRPETGSRRARGLAIAAVHTWAASAAHHVDAYRSAAGAAGRPPRGGVGGQPVG